MQNTVNAWTSHKTNLQRMMETFPSNDVQTLIEKVEDEENLLISLLADIGNTLAQLRAHKTALLYTLQQSGNDLTQDSPSTKSGSNIANPNSSTALHSAPINPVTKNSGGFFPSLFDKFQTKPLPSKSMSLQNVGDPLSGLVIEKN